jgi:surface protein
MSGMFNMSSAAPDPCRRRLSFSPTFNWPLNFDTSQVISMAGMFQGASAFNQPLSFDTSRVTDMSDMFHGATSYDQPLSFDTSHVMNMAEMFAQASAFNKPIQCTSRRACSFISGATGHRNRPLFRS